MHTFVYSSEQNAFWFADSTSAPADVVSVEKSVFEEFCVTPLDGKRRVAGDDGLPSWEDIPPPTAEEIKASAIAAAEQQKSQLLAEASEVTRGWQTDLLLGSISDADKAKLIEWRAYVKKLEAVDISSAPDIKWPTPPGEQAS
ncbi:MULTISPECIES: tail fiber assembly protein [Citrobacter]|uniref:tail fiber assembly protein n=1 Tax=Citrobacter TaxID=544 RepID=UPI001980161E|nr:MULTISPECIES: tail fiber assembly protein [Citrobacter]MBN4809223.1 tail fiber assembly protein [Citrobacter braakii]MBN4814221.1 tail fiber assembly protein [Citrobacter braakii]MBN4824324.1 tail fiber assembly protein [Citrobacter braakii]MBN4838271.1 tail fiber assembly protein [Citrobacter braakii]MBN4851913.1 tail fiber assembly protein [Citrobacter braakii]